MTEIETLAMKRSDCNVCIKAPPRTNGKIYVLPGSTIYISCINKIFLSSYILVNRFSESQNCLRKSLCSIVKKHLSQNESKKFCKQYKEMAFSP